MKFSMFVLFFMFGIFFNGSICFPEPRGNVRLSDLQRQIDDIRSELDGRVVHKRDGITTFLEALTGLVGDNAKQSTKQDTLVIFNRATLHKDLSAMQRHFTVDIVSEHETFNASARQFRNTTSQVKHDLLIELNKIEELYSQSTESEENKHALKNASMQVKFLLHNMTASIDTFTSLATIYVSNIHSEKSASKKVCNSFEAGNEEKFKPVSCQDVKESGVRSIYPDFKPTGIDVYCEIDEGKAWLVIQRRKYGTVNFERSWEEYKLGFGNLSGDFWLGNEHLFHMTKYRSRQLRIDMETFEGKKVYAMYNEFGVSSEEGKYRLKADVYTGDAGDALNDASYKHNGQMFSTYDSDNDIYIGYCCACSYHSGWWFNTCHRSNLNGKYYYKHDNVPTAQGITWFALTNSWSVMKFVEMKIY